MHSHGFIDRHVFDQQTILLADDCEDDVVIMRSALDRAGVPNPIQVVHDGEEAIAYLAGNGMYSDRKVYPMPAVVFLDLNMPRLGGLDVLEWVRQQPNLRLTSMLILSASSRQADITRAMELGANSYVIKPSKYVDLVEMLKAWYHFSRYQAMVVARDCP